MISLDLFEQKSDERELVAKWCSRMWQKLLAMKYGLVDVVVASKTKVVLLSV